MSPDGISDLKAVSLSRNDQHPCKSRIISLATSVTWIEIGHDVDQGVDGPMNWSELERFVGCVARDLHHSTGCSLRSGREEPTMQRDRDKTQVDYGKGRETREKLDDDRKETIHKIAARLARN